MIQPELPIAFQINRKHQPHFSNHEIVNVKIIKHIQNNKWAVSIKGQIFPAITDLKLNTGDTALAKVFFQADHLLLKIQNKEANPISQLIQQLQLPDQPLIHQVVSLLMGENMKISTEHINTLLKALKRLKTKDPEKLKLLVIMLKKGIDPNFEQLPFFMEMLQWGKQNHHPSKDRQDHNKSISQNNTKELARKIKEFFTPKKIEETSALALFNSLREDNPFWITLPYEFNYKNSHITGNFKILWNKYKKTFEQWVIFIYIDNREVQAVLNPSDKGYSMRFHCSDDELKKKIEKGFKILQKRIEPLNVNIQKVIYSENPLLTGNREQEKMSYRTINWVT